MTSFLLFIKTCLGHLFPYGLGRGDEDAFTDEMYRADVYTADAFVREVKLKNSITINGVRVVKSAASMCVSIIVMTYYKCMIREAYKSFNNA